MKVACIPALNAEHTIASLVLGCQKYVDLVIVCDDGSSDMTGEIAQRLGATLLRHDKNLGKGAAMRTLFSAVKDQKAEAMVTLDSDGQHSPDDIPILLGALSTADVVVGTRVIQPGKKMPAHRRTGNKVLSRMTSVGVKDTQSGFRAYGSKAIQSITPTEKGMGVDSEILMKARELGLAMVEVPVSVRYGGGKTSVNNPAFHALDVIGSILKQSSIRHPLVFYGIPGLALLVFGIYYAILTVEQVRTSFPVITFLDVSYGLVGFALLSFGLLTFFTAIILFTLTSIVREIQPRGTDSSKDL